MKISLINIAEEALKDKFVVVKKLSNNLIKVSYKGISPRNTPEEKIIAKKQARYEMQDNMTILVNSTIFTFIFKKLIKELLPIIKQDSKLRKAFLRGEFVVEKDTNTFYISEMTFCYNYKKEQWLCKYLIECLRLEGITEINENGDGFIRITGWDNYFKLWKLRIFDCCERKKEKFLSVIKQACIYLVPNANVINPIINSLDLTKKAIAKKININRSNFFRVLKNRQLLTIEQFNALTQLIDKNLDDYYNQINKIRIGKLTYLPFSREFIDFIVSEKFN